MSESSVPVLDLLRRCGLRATPQRRLILGAFHHGEHLTADDVCGRIAGSSDLPDRATVYRVLERFRNLGIVSETDLGDGARRFELMKLVPHHHLVCLGCHQIVVLDDAVIDPVRSEVLVRYSFAARIDHLAIYGWCINCQEAS